MKTYHHTNQIVLSGTKQEVLFTLKQAASTFKTVQSWIDHNPSKNQRPVLKRIK
ncbi:Z-ring formation inhibitor MciZ [Bacillus sp. JCM 19041]|uniref:Z-ring formation inhibitor MciZ n=1 Tax=Bacillus sp. JCM 19041 TaxID=1460637 RepID=UPI0009E9F7ED